MHEATRSYTGLHTSFKIHLEKKSIQNVALFYLMESEGGPMLDRSHLIHTNIRTDNFKIYVDQVRTNLNVNRTDLAEHPITFNLMSIGPAPVPNGWNQSFVGTSL